jgi:hypothetical protein
MEVYAGMLTATVEGGDRLEFTGAAALGGGRYGVAYPAVPLMLLLPAAFGFTDSVRTLSTAQIWRWSIRATWIQIQTFSPSNCLTAMAAGSSAHSNEFR